MGMWSTSFVPLLLRLSSTRSRALRQAVASVVVAVAANEVHFFETAFSPSLTTLCPKRW